MKKSVYVPALLCSALITSACSDNNETEQQAQNELTKPVVYQVFTRLFGNTQTANVPWGTKEQNGVGKFSDFNDAALKGIKELGTTHIWYTGVPHHALATSYLK